MKRLLFILPAAAFFALVYLFFRSLAGPPPEDLPSALLGKPAPATVLPPLDSAATAFTPEDLRAGHVTVLNVWASWCVPCRAEAPALAVLSGIKGVVLDAIVYKDTPARAREFLDEMRTPFAHIDLDSDGRAGIEWGVYGVPETFVIDGKGIVRLRYAGPIVGTALQDVIMPAIARARRRG